MKNVTSWEGVLQGLSTEDAAHLERALRRMRRSPKPGEVVQLGAVVIREQRVRCGKKRCLCSADAAAEAGVSPKLHGPYWYAWWWGREGQKRSAYAGPAVRKERVEAQVRVMDGLPVSLEQLQELAAVTEVELRRGWAGEAPGEAHKARVTAAVGRGELQPQADGAFDADGAVSWLKALGALGFRRRRSSR